MQNNLKGEEKMESQFEEIRDGKEEERRDSVMSGNPKDIRTLKQISEKYGISYDTLYKEIVKKNTLPFVKFGGIRVSESAFRNIFMQKGFVI